jgi:hypothetical protein
MTPIAIFEEQIKKDENGRVHDVQGWVGPEQGYSVPQLDENGNKTGVSTMEYPRYANYHVQIRDGRLSYWRIVFKDNAAVHVYESKNAGEWPAMELEGSGATGILRVAQIINAVMSLATEYCDERLEQQKTLA